MELKTKTLKNGIELVAIYSDRFKTDFFSLTLIRPMLDKENTKNALLPYLLKAGCAPYGSLKELNMALKEQYGAALVPLLRKKGNYQCFGFGMTYLKDAYAFEGDHISDSCFQILSDVMLYPKSRNGSFDETVLEMEKRNLKEKIESRINDKITYGIEKCSETMSRGTPYALSQYGEVDGLTADKNQPEVMFSHYRNVLKSSRVWAFYVGEMSMDELAEKVERHFGEMQTVSTQQHAEPLTLSPEGEGEFSETMALNQCKLTMGFSTGITMDDDDYFAMVMANAVFGGGPTSKLFMNVREKMSLCYYAAARYNRLNGQVVVYSGVEQKNVQVAKQEILNQLQQLQQGNVTDEEFSAARMSMVNALNSVCDSAGGMEDYYLGETFGKAPLSIDDFVAGLERVTKEQAVKAAGKLELYTTYVLQGEERDGNE